MLVVASGGSKSRVRAPAAAELPAFAAPNAPVVCPVLPSSDGFVSLQYSAWVGGNSVVASKLRLGPGTAAENLLLAIADNPERSLKTAESSAPQG